MAGMSDPTCPLPASYRLRLLRNAEREPWSGQTSIPSRQKVQTTAITEPGRPTFVCVTFDVGYHNSGWWANADYNRCWHISISHTGDGYAAAARRLPTRLIEVGPDGGLRRKVEAPEDRETRAWARAFFGADARLGWMEPPASTLDPYRLPGVAHYRLFAHPETGVPFLPDGEVYHLRPYSGSPAKILDGRLGGDVR